MNDTTPEIEQMVRTRLVALSGAERVRIGSNMFEAARRMALASLPEGLSENDRRYLLFERIYGQPWPGTRG